MRLLRMSIGLPRSTISMTEVVLPDNKICRLCGLLKPSHAFPPRYTYNERECKTCVNIRAAVNRRSRQLRDPMRHAWKELRNKCKSKSLAFNLTPEYLTSIWSGRCPVLGYTLSFETHRGCDEAPELDQFHPKLGYTEGNVAWISRRANRIKNDATLEEIENLYIWMGDHVKSNL